MENTLLKNKIIYTNSYSILFILVIFSILSFATTYFALNDIYKQEITITQKEYINSQKAIIKNQVNNFINFIDHTRKIVKMEKLNILQKNVKALSHVLSVSDPKNFIYMLQNSKKKTPFFEIGLSDTKGNVIFATGNSHYHKQFRLKAIKKGYGKILVFNTEKGIKYSYILKFRNKIDGKEYVIGNAIFQSTIDARVKKIVLDRIKTISFGAKNNGYISIAEILNYKGGKGFARVVAIPIKPEWVGKLLDDDKKDAKGKMYRKEYLKIANTTGEGYVSYWFFKKKTKQLRPKLSYVKLYKPYNWLIFTGVYLDDINDILAHKDSYIKLEIRKIFLYYSVIVLLFLLVGFFISKYENKIIKKLIDSYEEEINIKNKELLNINQNLEQEVQRKTNELVDALLTDSMTKLPNREKLLLYIENKNIFIAVLNIDGFKEINDFYGLETGDIVLQKIANILKVSISNDVYKLSADEFAIVSDDLNDLESKIYSLFYILTHKSIKINNIANINISLSCGIGKTMIEADMALKYAKKHKTQRIVVFNEELNIRKEYENNIKWKNIIHKAIEKDNIIPFIQPIINVKTKQIEKYECLVRLKDGDKIYSPYFFLDISKHTHQYYDIQKIMVEKTFKKFQNLDYKFSINISTIDLTNKGFKQFLLHKIDEYDIADKLIIELLEDEELLQKDVLKYLQLLKDKGIKFAIDDFGSGYSNFAYLLNLPISIIKIDGTLIKNIDKNNKDYKVLKAITHLIKDFDLEIVAEYVENKEIFSLLEKIEIDYAQGYYFSAPFDMNQLN